MFSLSVKTNFPQVQRALNDLQADLSKTVLVRSVNRTMEQGRTAMSREIRGEYNVTAGYVRERLQLRKASYRAGRFQVVATLSGSGRGGAKRAANVIAFGARQAKKGVSVKIKRQGSRQVIQGAFIANKGRTVFVRTGKARLPIRPVQTIDVPQMFTSRKVSDAVIGVIERVFPQVFEREARFALQRFSRGGR